MIDLLEKPELIYDVDDGEIVNVGDVTFKVVFYDRGDISLDLASSPGIPEENTKEYHTMIAAVYALLDCNYDSEENTEKYNQLKEAADKEYAKYLVHVRCGDKASFTRQELFNLLQSKKFTIR